MAVEIVRSQTWMSTMDDIDVIGGILDDVISDHLDDPLCVIINIETKERNGLCRFWIYYQRLN